MLRKNPLIKTTDLNQVTQVLFTGYEYTQNRKPLPAQSSTLHNYTQNCSMTVRVHNEYIQNCSITATVHRAHTDSVLLSKYTKNCTTVLRVHTELHYVCTVTV